MRTQSAAPVSGITGSGKTNKGNGAIVSPWDVATELALAGIPVFPCKSNKQPYTLNGFKDATTDLEVIDQWCVRYPDALIAVPTGKASGLLVVDIDPDGTDWYAEHSAELACGRVHHTRRGHHLLYRMPDADIRNSASKIAEGVDVRGNGGYIIWWPAHGLEVVGDMEDLTEPPQWLLDQLTVAVPKISAEPALRANLRSIPEKKRNATLTSMAGRMRRAGADQTEIECALREFNRRCTPPLDDAEVMRIAASVARYAPAQNAQAMTITARHIGEIIAKPSRVRWLIRNELERGVIAVLAGKRGTFKSFVALHWAMRIATAGEPVLMVSAEGSGMDRRTLAWLKTHSPRTDASSLPIYAIERRVDFNSFEGIGAVMEEIARLDIKPAMIVIDTLSKNSGGLDENDNSEVKEFIGRIDVGLRTPLDATVLIVAHTGHGDQTRARGASALEADTDAAYIVQKHSEGMVSVSRERFKDAAELPPLNYQVQVVDLGYCDDYGEPVTSCALVATDAIPEIKKPELRGKAQRQLLAALRARNQAGKIWTLNDMRAVGRELGLHKNSARAASEALAFSPFMTQTVGGYTLND